LDFFVVLNFHSSTSFSSAISYSFKRT
jgi:hypothetical protein